MIRSIPLKKLVPSLRNVRRVTDEGADAELKADIEARGLLQNLVVTAAAKPRGSFAVEAGGRRLRALHSLVSEGKLPADHEVCCFVLGDNEGAQEASLAENFQRLAMNPADECLAFQQLIEQGADAEGIARRFGLTVRFVEGRLRLAALAPVVFDALGAGEITLDVAKAYAATPDRERQVQVFEQLGRGYGYAHPDSVRRMMTQVTASASDRRAKLVGEEAYVAAGGRIERDLFSEEGDARWLDVALLERLAGEKMETLAAATAAEQGLGWVRPCLDSWVGQRQTEGLHRVSAEAPPPDEAETKEVEALEAEIELLSGVLEDEATEERVRDEAEARVRVLGDRIEAILCKPAVIADALKPRVGRFLILDHEGRPTLDSGFYAETSVEAETLDVKEDGAQASGAGPTPVKATGLSQRLADELAMQRRDILAVHVASDPALALDLAIFMMVDRDAGRFLEKSGSTLAAPRPADPVFELQTPDAAANRAAAEYCEALDRSWVGGRTKGDRFDRFRALPEEARGAWLGYAVARTLEASLGFEGNRSCPFHDHLGRLVGIDVAAWWRPTGANFFDRVPKSVALAALEEVGGPAFASRYSGGKKAELAQSCERIFSGNFIADEDVKARALAWVPEPMLFAAPAASPLPADETPPWEDVTEGAAGAPEGEGEARLDEAA